MPSITVKKFSKRKKDIMEKKLAYIAPKVNTAIIELEQGIAAGSACARPEDANSGKVSEQWEAGSTDNRNIDW